MTWLNIVSIVSAFIYVVGGVLAIYFEVRRYRVISEKDKRQIGVNQFKVGLIVSLPMSILFWQIVHDKDYPVSLLASLILAGVTSLMIWALIYGVVWLLFVMFGGISKIRDLG